MKITIYTTPSCPYSKLAKDYLTEKGFEFEEKNAEKGDIGIEMVNISCQFGVPVIDIDGQIIVGWDKDRIDKALGIIPRKIATETVKMEDINLCPSCNTMKHFTGEKCSRCSKPWWHSMVAQAFSRGTLEQCISKMEVVIEEAQRAKMEELKNQLFNLKELDKEWFETFYESDWKSQTLNLTDLEKQIVEDLTSFLPRHMKPYDWNLPFADAIILIIRKNLSKLK